MDDVIVVGAGPAGALAALRLARRGARVRLVDRARFPRPKLCGDTLNPGALAQLAIDVDVAPIIARSLPVAGMRLSGPGGVTLEGRYGGGIAGRALPREALDQVLVAAAVAAGVAFEDGVAVVEASQGTDGVAGVTVRHRDGRTSRLGARMVVAADGRRSALAFARGLARQPRRPRRWAIGAYFEGVAALADVGEMHVRRGHYIGVAPLPGGIANACLVVERLPGDRPIADPSRLLADRLRADPLLGPRFEAAAPVRRAVMLGPMAVDTTSAGEPGLLLAGDAAGFIDPMTGDGLRLAFAGAALAAAVVGDVFEGRVARAMAHEALARRRARTLAAKFRFNRMLRALVASPAGVDAAAPAARLAPAVFASMIRYAGDVSHASPAGAAA